MSVPTAQDLEALRAELKASLATMNATLGRVHVAVRDAGVPAAAAKMKAATDAMLEVARVDGWIDAAIDAVSE